MPPTPPKNRRRRQQGIAAVPLSGSVALATLADEAVILAALSGGLVDPFYAISADVAINAVAGTGGEMVLVGLSHGDYSVTEVKEALEVEILGKSVDMINLERARRKVRDVSLLNLGAQKDEVEVKRVPLRFTLGTGKTLNLFVKNRSGAALTTGALVKISGKMYGRWS